MFSGKMQFIVPVLFLAAMASQVGCAPVLLPGVDTIPPTVISTNPASAATGGTLNQRVRANFSEFMTSASIDASSFLVTGPGGTPVSGSVSYDGATRIATFVPTNNLPPSTEFTGRVTTSVTDLSGNPMTIDYTWTFTTGTTMGQAPVELNSSSAFAVLAATSLTNNGGSTVTGDIGVSPGIGIFGFPPGVLIGAPHTNDPLAMLAQDDLAAAYNDAQSRSIAVPVAGDLGGLTLAPGLYKSISTLEITSGDLTLDSTGDSEAVYIFQVASTFTVADGRKLILNGGVKATNVFWQVGDAVTVGTNAVFSGNILADVAVQFKTGATMDGRILSRNGAVELNTNTVTTPAP